MRNLLILAAAASLAVGCHNRSEDEVGAAPDRGDTTAVASDTAKAVPTDSTMGQVKTDTTTMSADTTMNHDSTGVTSDSTTQAAPPSEQAAPPSADSTTSAWPDSTSAAPTDSTAPKQ